MTQNDKHILVRAITQSEINEYDKNGVVCLRGLFSTYWIDFMRAAFDEAKENHGPYAQSYGEKGVQGELFFDVDIWTRLPQFRDYVFNSPVAEIAATLMASSCSRLFYDQIFIKEPGEVAPTPWHQDLPYWQADGEQICTVWMPLDKVSRATGVEYVRGSHKTDVMYGPVAFSADQKPYEGDLPTVPDIDADRSQFDIVSWDVEPGDCLVFHAKILHGARSGQQVNRRRALATRWCGDDAHYVIRANKTNIPTSDPGLKPGDPIAGTMFPEIWPRAAVSE